MEISASSNVFEGLYCVDNIIEWYFQVGEVRSFVREAKSHSWNQGNSLGFMLEKSTSNLPTKCLIIGKWLHVDSIMSICV